MDIPNYFYKKKPNYNFTYNINNYILVHFEKKTEKKIFLRGTPTMFETNFEN